MLGDAIEQGRGLGAAGGGAARLIASAGRGHGYRDHDRDDSNAGDRGEPPRAAAAGFTRGLRALGLAAGCAALLAQLALGWGG